MPGRSTRADCCRPTPTCPRGPHRPTFVVEKINMQPPGEVRRQGVPMQPGALFWSAILKCPRRDAGSRASNSPRLRTARGAIILIGRNCRPDLKSLGRKAMWVRSPPRAPTVSEVFAAWFLVRNSWIGPQFLLRRRHFCTATVAHVVLGHGDRAVPELGLRLANVS